jgi:hypothetical protein
MTHVNLDAQPEVVRQFVLALSASPEEVILESAGRPGEKKWCQFTFWRPG